jgi:Proliferating cell nuclear antigen, C-terminal domain.
MKIVQESGPDEELSGGISIEMNQHISLTFSLKYLVNFRKSSSFSDSVQLAMINYVPLLVCLPLTILRSILVSCGNRFELFALSLFIFIRRYDMPQPTRKQQRVTSGLGVAFSSPIKRGDKRKTTTYVAPLGQAPRRQRLAEMVSVQLILSGEVAFENPAQATSSKK